MTTLTLEKAAGIVDAALRRGRELHLKPLTVAVLDAGGHLLAFKREDRSGILRPEIAQAKAWGALGLGLGSRALAQPQGRRLTKCSIARPSPTAPRLRYPGW